MINTTGTQKFNIFNQSFLFLASSGTQQNTVIFKQSSQNCKNNIKSRITNKLTENI